MIVKGRITRVNETQVISDKFKKRDLWIVTNEQYPQDLSIQFVQEKCDILNNYKEGQDVEIGINLRGNKYTNKLGEENLFNTIQGWKISTLNDIQESDELI